MTDLNATSDASTPSGPWRASALLFLVVTIFSLPQAALMPLLDRDEPRFAEASREMLQSGNFTVPTFNHAPRYAKPPLIYWCQAACFTVLGENALAARLPSVAATAGTAALLLVWGTELGSVCIGTIAGLAYAFCLQTVQQGRVATADGLLIFFMTLTAYAGWKLLVLSRRYYDRNSPSAYHYRQWNGWGAVLALGFAGGFLAKGPEALLPILPLLVTARHSNPLTLWMDTKSFSLLLTEKGHSKQGTTPCFCAIFLLGLFIASFWAIPAYIESHGDYWRIGLSEGIGQRAVTGLQGHGATTFGWYLADLPYYLLFFWLSALPWSPLLVTHRKRLFTGWKPDAAEVYLMLNAGLIFIVFTLMATKLPHYTLPAFPFLTLLLARRWTAAGLHPALPTQLAGGLGLALALLTAVLVPIALANGLTPSPVGSLVQEAQGAITPGTHFALVDFEEPNAIWEMRRATEAYADSIPAEGVISYLNEAGPRAVVLSTARWEQLAGQSDPAWKTFRASGWNTAKGVDTAKGSLALIDLTLVVKE